MKKQIATIIQRIDFYFKSVLIILILCIVSESKASTDGESIFDAMNYKDILELNLKTDIENLKTNRRSEESQIAEIRFEDRDGKLQSWTVDVSMRGKFRRMFSKQIPPLKLNFKKKELEFAGYSSFDDMNLVTFFLEDDNEAFTTLYKEFIVYKLYNVLTEHSYRVQLLNITYEDVNTGDKDKQWAFLIEDTAQLRNRTGVDKCDQQIYELTEDQFDPENSKLVSVFQYMIGNSDWSLTTGKNIDLLFKGDKVIMVPFDFDFCGLVNAPYAVPNNIYDIKSVRDRIFFGHSAEIGNLIATLEIFEKKKDEFNDVIKSSKKLNSEERDEMLEYLDGFFAEIKIRKSQSINLDLKLPVK